MKSSWSRVVLGAVISAVLISLVLSDRFTGLAKRFEYDLYDLRINSFTTLEPDPRIVIVDIDERSLGEIGRWPWSRAVVSDLLDQLFDRYEAVLVGFDIVFSESDTRVELDAVQREINQRLTSGDPLSAESIIEALNPDSRLSDALQDRLVVLGYLFDNTLNAIERGSPGAPVIADKTPLSGISIPESNGVISSTEALRQHVIWSGFFDNPRVDSDGVYRRVPLLQRYRDDYYPSLPLAMMLSLLGESFVEPIIVTDSTKQFRSLSGISLASSIIPTDEQGSILVPYRGPQSSFQYVSAAQVLRGTADPTLLNGAIVLIGTSAAGLFDLRVTPFSSSYPGVEIHANILSALLDERYLHQPDYTAGFELVQLTLTAVILSLLIPFTSVVTSLFGTLLWFSLLVGFNYYAWTELNWVVPLGYTLILMMVLYLCLQVAGYFTEARRTAKLTSQFGRYIPPEVVQQLSKTDSEVQMSGESRELTIFFSDLRGFTSISEGLTPQQITRLMNIYLTEMTSVIHQYRGTIDKYIGDAIMAFWGAPLAETNHADLGLEAALVMQQRIAKVNEQLLNEGLPTVSVGMGLNTGVANVGNMGSSFRTTYTAMGDAVNIASRLEGLTKYYGCSIVVSEYVVEQTKGQAFRSLDLVRVKGKQEAIEIFEPFGAETALSTVQRDLLQLNDSALADYRAGQFSEAELQFQQILYQAPEDPISKIYLERIKSARINPTHEWSPIHSHSSK